MCRLFALYANKPVQIEFSMLRSDNSFQKQSLYNNDGWGIAYYKDGSPVVEKEAVAAHNSSLFKEVSKSATSRIFIAHVRRASSGTVKKRNSHPFQFGNWVFAHNGTLDKDVIKAQLREPYSMDFQSEPIDSELYFRLILQNLEDTGSFVDAVKKTAEFIYENSYFQSANFVMSDGKKIYAFKSYDGFLLYFLIRNPQSDFDLTYIRSLETSLLLHSKMLNREKAVIVASETLTSEEAWVELMENELLIIDEQLNTSLIHI